MKKIIEVNNDLTAMEELLGETIVLLCWNYIYTGKLVGVNDVHVELENPSIVYVTGAWDADQWKDAQRLPGNCFVMKASVESYFRSNK